jgi:IPT/TIG domain./FG-GAP repeat.
METINYCLFRHFLSSIVIKRFPGALVILLFLSLRSFGQVPIINSVSPISGSIGSNVTIQGNNFNPSVSGNIIFFGAVRANVLSATSTAITVQVPFGATYQPISVTTNGLTSYSNLPFSVTFSGGSTLSSSTFPHNFDSTTDYNAEEIVATDLDGDGKVDVAAANFFHVNGEPGQLTVLRNNGSPGIISFEYQKNFIDGPFSHSIAAADLNGDGKPEIITSSIMDSSISIFQNTSTPGNIQFAPRIVYPADDGYWISVNDLDGDGKPDIVVTSYISGNIVIYRNISTVNSIAFAPAIILQTYNSSKSVVIGDIDGDGKPEIIKCNEFQNSISVYRNTSTTGNIVFNTKVDYSCGSGNQPDYLALGDLNNDGKIDLAVSFNSNSNGGIEVFRNNSSTGSISLALVYTVASPSGSSTHILAINDLNGDGKPDILVSASAPDMVMLIQNSSIPTSFQFWNPVQLPLDYAYSPAIADFDGDGKPDISINRLPLSRVAFLRSKVTEPAIISFTPKNGLKGDTILISGANFSNINSVTFGNTPAASFSYFGNSIRAILASGASGMVKVSGPNGSDSLGGFIFGVLAPKITSFKPVATGKDSIVTITGSNFSTASSVSFGGTPAKSFTVVSNTTITAIVDTGSTGKLKITTDGGTDSLDGFRFIPAPIITSINPEGGAPGTYFSIRGHHLWDGIAEDIVTIGSVPVIAAFVESDSIVSVLVAPGNSGIINLSNHGGSTSFSGYNLPPTITSFSPASTSPGGIITLYGTHFLGTTSVSIGGVNALSFKIIDAQTLQVTVGANNNGDINITTYGGTATIPVFVLVPKPAITSFSPHSGPIGSLVTISGSGFASTADSNIIYFGAVRANVISASTSSLIVRVPKGISYSPIKVIKNNVIAYSAEPFIEIFSGAKVSLHPENFNKVIQADAGTTIPKIAIADLDGDGFPDIIGANKTYGEQTVVLRNKGVYGQTLFDSVKIINLPYYNYDVATEDIDGDGKLDIISADIGAHFSRNRSTKGSLKFDDPVDLPIGPASALVVADFDGDGRPDIAGATSTTDLEIIRNTSTNGIVSFDLPVYATKPPYPEYVVSDAITCADFNGDGKVDIVINNEENGKIYVYRNTSTLGKISFAAPVPYYVGTNPSSMCTGDLDGDGKPDLVVSCFQENIALNYQSVFIFRNTSSDSITFAPKLEVKTDHDPAGLAIHDMDGDGKPDIIVADFFQHVINVLKNTSQTGNLSFNMPIQYGQNAYSFFPAVSDFDLDGKPDIAIAQNYFNGDVSVYKNSIGDTIHICSNSDTMLQSNVLGGSYQWQQRVGQQFINLSDSASISGTTTAQLRLTKIQASMAGKELRCVVDSGFSGRYILMMDDQLQPKVTLQSSDTTICPGTSVKFLALPYLENASPNYQWTINGTVVTSVGDQFSTDQLKDSDRVQVVLSGTVSCSAASTATSNIVTMHVNPNPVVTVMNDTSICKGTSISLFAKGAFSYQWVPSVGLDNANYQVPRATPDTNTKYTVYGTDTHGCTSSASITISLRPTFVPAVTITATSDTICLGSSITFHTSTTYGGTQPHFKWISDYNYVGSDSNALSLTPKYSSYALVQLTSNADCAIPTNVNSNVIYFLVSPYVSPSVSISGTTSVNAGTVVSISTYEYNLAPEATYQWQDSSDIRGWQNITGGTNYNINYKPLVSGARLRLKVNPNNICSPTSIYTNTLVFTLNSITAIDPVNGNPLAVRMYPNPVHDNFIVDSLSPSDHWEYAQILSLDGNAKGQIISLKNKNSIQVSTVYLSKGFYVFTLRKRNGQLVYLKFLKL